MHCMTLSESLEGTEVSVFKIVQNYSCNENVVNQTFKTLITTKTFWKIKLVKSLKIPIQQ